MFCIHVHVFNLASNLYRKYIYLEAFPNILQMGPDLQVVGFGYFGIGARFPLSGQYILPSLVVPLSFQFRPLKDQSSMGEHLEQSSARL